MNLRGNPEAGQRKANKNDDEGQNRATAAVRRLLPAKHVTRAKERQANTERDPVLPCLLERKKRGNIGLG